MMPDDGFLWPIEKLARFTPVQTLDWTPARAAGVRISVKREDLLHPLWGGNKVYKSAYYLEAFRQSGAQQLLTFGGAYSNHLLSMAAQCEQLSIPMVAVIRGEAPATPSPTLRDLYELGVRCHFVSRAAYRKKASPVYLKELESLFGPFFCVPEGAGGLQGSQGCYDWAYEALQQAKGESERIDALCVAVGTGGTCAGLLAAAETVPVHGFLALKGSIDETTAMATAIQNQATEVRQSRGLAAIEQALRLETDYHFGGYAKKPARLLSFVESFQAETGMPLDYVYTAKVFYGLAEKLKQGAWPRSSHILVMHSGGLQGNRTL